MIKIMNNEYFEKEVGFQLDSWVEVSEKHVKNHPDKVAITYPGDDESGEEHWTYSQLIQKSKAIASELQNRCEAGERALLIFQSVREFLPAFLGCMFAGVIAVPMSPIRGKRNISRINLIIEDSDATVLLTSTSMKSRLDEYVDSITAIQKVRNLILTDLVEPALALNWKPFIADPASVAVLQYTSGTTAIPKGVMVTHDNLLYNSTLIRDSFKYTPESIGLIWLPHYHDMGLVGGLLQPLFTGFQVVVMKPESFLQKPVRWLQTITKYKVTTSGGPNFAFDLCIRKIPVEQRASLNLDSWDLAFIGAEPVRNETMERFISEFSPYGFNKEAFFPCYGLAEATLAVSTSLKHTPPVKLKVDLKMFQDNMEIKSISNGENGRVLVSSGRSSGDYNIVIVDPVSKRRCLDNSVGEIWVSGRSVAAGYWRRESETDEFFHACLADNSEEEFLRTGDLGCFIDGELFVTGRLKDMMIIRGKNYYPQDVEEWIAQNNSCLSPDNIAVFSIDDGISESLVIAVELERVQLRTVNVDKLVIEVRESLSGLELETNVILILKPGSLSKTSSGKKQRYLYRKNYLEDNFKVVHTWTSHKWQERAPYRNQYNSTITNGVEIDTIEESYVPVEEYDFSDYEPLLLDPAYNNNQPVIEDWIINWIHKRVGGELTEIMPDKSFVYYGIDSVTAIEMGEELQKWLGITLSPSTAWNYPNITALAAFLDESLKKSSIPNVNNTPDTNDDFSVFDMLAKIENMSEEEVNDALK